MKNANPVVDAVFVKQLLESDDETLYFQLGQYLHGKPAFPLQPKPVIDLAKRWLSEKCAELAKEICVSSKVKAFAATDLAAHERVVLVCAIADTIAHKYTGTAAATIAALLARQGIHKLCCVVWEAEKKARDDHAK